MPSPQPPPDLEVVRLVPSQWRAYRELRLEMLLDAPTAFWARHDELVGRDESYWRLRSTSSTFQARDAEGTPLGQLTVLVPTALEAGLRWDDAMLLAVYVRPRARGRGVLEAMLDQAIPMARDDLGASRLVLHVSEDNHRAAAAYRRLAFVPTGEWLVHPATGRRDLEMALAL